MTCRKGKPFPAASRLKPKSTRPLTSLPGMLSTNSAPSDGVEGIIGTERMKETEDAVARVLNLGQNRQTGRVDNQEITTIQRENHGNPVTRIDSDASASGGAAKLTLQGINWGSKLALKVIEYGARLLPCVPHAVQTLQGVGESLHQSKNDEAGTRALKAPGTGDITEAEALRPEED